MNTVKKATPGEQVADLSTEDEGLDDSKQILKDLEIEKAKARVKVADVTLAALIRRQRGKDEP